MSLRNATGLYKSLLLALVFRPIPCSFAAANYSKRMAFTTERSSGTITVSPKNEGDQSALVVISHGLGDTAEGFVDVAEVRVLTSLCYSDVCV